MTMNEKLNQKYLKPTDDICSVTIDSHNLLNVIDMIRTYPTAARTLLYLTANTDYMGAVKFKVDETAKSLNTSNKNIVNCIKFLEVNGYIELVEPIDIKDNTVIISLDMLYSDSNKNTSNIYNYAKAYDERVSDEELEYVADVEQEWEQ